MKDHEICTTFWMQSDFGEDSNADKNSADFSYLKNGYMPHQFHH